MKKKVAITLDEDVYIKAKEIAKFEDRKLSNYINKILKDNLFKKK